MTPISIRTISNKPLSEFLQSQNFNCETINDKVTRISREDFEVYVHYQDSSLYFETPVGSLNKLKSLELYEDLLDLNTEVLPVSLGLDKSQPGKLLLVIVESRETSNLDENELMSVLQAIEITYAKVEVLLGKYMQQK